MIRKKEHLSLAADTRDALSSENGRLQVRAEKLEEEVCNILKVKLKYWFVFYFFIIIIRAGHKRNIAALVHSKCDEKWIHLMILEHHVYVGRIPQISFNDCHAKCEGNQP